MMPSTFSKRLKRCALRAALGPAELSHFFDRDYQTVRLWLLGEREPEGVRAEDALSRLANLEVLISTKDYFPMPLWSGKRKRAEFMQLLGGGSDCGRDAFFEIDPAVARPLYRTGKKGRGKKAKRI